MEGVSIPKDIRRSLSAWVKAKAMRTVAAALWESFMNRSGWKRNAKVKKVFLVKCLLGY